MERKVAKNVDDLIQFWKDDIEFEVDDVDEEGNPTSYIAYKCDFNNINIDFDLNLPFSKKIIDDMEMSVFQNINTLKFNDCIFLKTLYINDSDINFEFINGCVLKGKLRCHRYSKNLTFKDSILKDINFENAVFGGKEEKNDKKGKVRLQNCELYDTNFSNTTFNGLVDFWKSTFHNSVIFYKTDFNATTVFSAVKFKENTLFTYSSIADKAIFRGTKFRLGLDLSLAIIKGDLNLFDLNLKYFNHSEPKNEREYEFDVSKIGGIPLKNKQETYRIIKKHYESQSNHVKALDYKFLERSAQSKATINEIIRKERHDEEGIRVFLYNKIKALANQIIHFLNTFSNAYGKSYSLGIVFTLIVGFIFFNLSLFGTSKYIFAPFEFDLFTIVNENNTSYFLNFLNPTHKFDYLPSSFIQDCSKGKWFYIWDFIGRILVGYGLYQTVQAFRKYR